MRPNIRSRSALLLCAGLMWAWSSGLSAFHEQGVANCDGCHIQHESEDGGRPVEGLRAGEALLRGETPTEVCLMCHAKSFGAVLGVNPLAPPPELGGGNFVFLLEDNLNDGPDGASDPILGDAAGHNVVAPAYRLASDAVHAVAPGGTFPASQLGCTSCHDPHGNTNFRMLHDAGTVQGGIASFSWPAPQAAGISLTGGSESPSNHNAYRRGMSDWCANCHGDYHDVAGGVFEHAGDAALGVEVSQRYNAYNGDDDPQGGSPGTAYLPQVPFEDPGISTSSRQGPSGGSRVMCLTCHRAHASSAPDAGRWDFNVTLLSDDGVISGSYPLPDPYHSPNQGSLCSKCHEAPPSPSPTK
jgi:predicted CXXCH cytochrome family protein